MKRCTMCGEAKPVDAFHRNRRRADGRQNVCKACKRDYNRRYYRANAARHAPMRRRHAQRLRAEIDAMIAEAKSVPCTDCGKTYPAEAMDLDHVRGTKQGDARAIRRMGVARARAEIEKCDPVCVMCHRRRTLLRRRRRRMLRAAGWR